MPGPLKDRELLRAYAENGAEDAFQTLVGRHVDLVFATALRGLNDSAAASEVTQNVFIALARKAVWLGNETTLAGWLHKATLLEVRQYWRGEFRRRRREQTAIELATTMKDDDSLLKSLGVVLDEGLLHLRDADRQVLLLRYFEGRTHREIAAQLGAREDAVRKRVDAALEKLANFFRRRGYAVSAGATAAAALGAAAQAAPASLATATAQAALSAGAASATGLQLFLARLFSPFPVALACACLASFPVGRQWHALARARAERAGLTQRLAQSTRAQADADNQLRALQSRLARANRALLSTRADIAVQKAAAVAAKTNYFAWSNDSDYVRLPKDIVGDLVLSEYYTTNENSHTHRVQRPIASEDGGLSPVATEVFGITHSEADGLTKALLQFVRDYESARQAHFYETNQLPSGFGCGQPSSRMFVTTAFPAEAEKLRDTLELNWGTTLGANDAAQEREDALFNQSRNAEVFHEFAKKQIYEVVGWGNGNVAYGHTAFDPVLDPQMVNTGGWTCTTGSSVAFNIPAIVPEHLRPYLPDLATKDENP